VWCKRGVWVAKKHDWGGGGQDGRGGLGNHRKRQKNNQTCQGGRCEGEKPDWGGEKRKGNTWAGERKDRSTVLLTRKRERTKKVKSSEGYAFKGNKLRGGKEGGVGKCMGMGGGGERKIRSHVNVVTISS